MSEKQVKRYKRSFVRYQNKLWCAAYETLLKSIPKKRGIKRMIFCLKLVFQKDVANFLQQQLSAESKDSTLPNGNVK